MTACGPSKIRKSPLLEEPMYPQSKQERQKLIDAVMLRRREIYRKYFENLRKNYEEE
jgi:hypothetical protein